MNKLIVTFIYEQLMKYMLSFDGHLLTFQLLERENNESDKDNINNTQLLILYS